MHEKHPATGHGRRIALAGLVIIVAAGIGYLLQRQLGHRVRTITLVTTQAVTTPAPAPAAKNTPEKKPLPDTLPQFKLKDRDGKLRKLADWTGQPLVVNYWATWCPPCVREIPLLRKLRHDRRAQKLEVIGIAIDFRDDVLAFATRKQIDYPLLIGEEDGLAAVSAVGMEPAFPFTVFADSRQRIVALKVGELHEDEAVLILDRVAAVDAGRLDMPAAREQISEGLKALATQRALAAPVAPAAAGNPAT